MPESRDGRSGTQSGKNIQECGRALRYIAYWPSHGRSSVKHDLTRWPAERALVYNLRNPLYVQAVYGDLASMPRLFADVFDRVAAVREEAQPHEATVRLARRRRKTATALDHVTAIRRLVAQAWRAVPEPRRPPKSNGFWRL